MVEDILNEYWNDWKFDKFPLDRRMKRVFELIPGYTMGTENPRLLINELVKRSSSNVYVEVGTWVGHSLLAAALYNPDTTCIGIDNLSVHSDEAVDRLREALKIMPSNVQFIEGNFQDVLPTLVDYIGKVGVYYYDGDHSHESTMLGLHMAKPLMAPKSYIVVDDMTLEPVSHAVRRFVDADMDWNPELIIVPKREMRIENKYHPWYNGLAVLKRRT